MTTQPTARGEWDAHSRTKGWACPQRSAPLEVYEEQIRAYLESFHIPDDCQQRILEMQEQLHQNYDVEKEQKQLKARLDRAKELHSWGDIGRDKYLADENQIQSDLARLAPFKTSNGDWERLADFLANKVKAWDGATQEQVDIAAHQSSCAVKLWD